MASVPLAIFFHPDSDGYIAEWLDNLANGQRIYKHRISIFNFFLLMAVPSATR